MRRALDLAGMLAALAVLGCGVFLMLAREVVPQLPNLAFGALDRSRFEELAAMPPQDKLDALSELEAIRDLRAHTPEDATFVVFVQNTFAYYAGRRFIRDVDPRMADFYRAADKEAALAVLRRLGVGYVYLPGWSWPTVDHSFIKAIVEDPALAEPVAGRFGYRTFRLKPAPHTDGT
jgi:hypothetical protein